MADNAVRLGDIERHFWLTRSVSRVMGLSLSSALADKRLSADEYATMVSQCRAQECREACQRWLAAQTGARPDGPPEYCANAALLLRLSPGHDDR